MRIFMFIFVGIALGDKLDRTYLPPPGFKFSGGSPGALQTPLEFPKETYSTSGSVGPNVGPSFGQYQRPSNPQPNQQGIAPEDQQSANVGDAFGPTNQGQQRLSQQSFSTTGQPTFGPNQVQQTPRPLGFVPTGQPASGSNQVQQTSGQQGFGPAGQAVFGQNRLQQTPNRQGFVPTGQLAFGQNQQQEIAPNQPAFGSNQVATGPQIPDIRRTFESNQVQQQPGASGRFPDGKQGPAFETNQDIVNLQTGTSEYAATTPQRPNEGQNYGSNQQQPQFDSQGFIQPGQLPNIPFGPSSQSPLNNFQNNVPSTTTAYAFTQTTISPFDDALVTVPPFGVDGQRPFDIPVQVNYPQNGFAPDQRLVTQGQPTGQNNELFLQQGTTGLTQPNEYGQFPQQGLIVPTGQTQLNDYRPSSQQDVTGQTQQSYNERLQQNQKAGAPNQPGFSHPKDSRNQLQQQNYSQQVPTGSFTPQGSLYPGSGSELGRPQSGGQLNNYQPSRGSGYQPSQPSTTPGSFPQSGAQFDNAQPSPFPGSQPQNQYQGFNNKGQPIQQIVPQNKYSTTASPPQRFPQRPNQYQNGNSPVTSTTVSPFDEYYFNPDKEDIGASIDNQTNGPSFPTPVLDPRPTPGNFVSTPGFDPRPPPGNFVSSTATSIIPGEYSPSATGGKMHQDFVQRRPERVQADADRNAAILNYENNLTPEGEFNYSFDTSNGIHADENGTSIDGVKAQGSFSYTGDDGKVYSVTYSADENGFVPMGDHLPTSPPIPEAIKRVIEQAMRDKEAGITNDGSYDEAKYGYKKYKGKMDRYRPQTYYDFMKNNTIMQAEQDKQVGDIAIKESDNADRDLDYETLEAEIDDIKAGSKKPASSVISDSTDSKLDTKTQQRVSANKSRKPSDDTSEESIDDEGIDSEFETKIPSKRPQITKSDRRKPGPRVEDTDDGYNSDDEDAATKRPKSERRRPTTELPEDIIGENEEYKTEKPSKRPKPTKSNRRRPTHGLPESTEDENFDNNSNDNTATKLPTPNVRGPSTDISTVEEEDQESETSKSQRRRPVSGEKGTNKRIETDFENNNRDNEDEQQNSNKRRPGKISEDNFDVNVKTMNPSKRPKLVDRKRPSSTVSEIEESDVNSDETDIKSKRPQSSNANRRRPNSEVTNTDRDDSYNEDETVFPSQRPQSSNPNRRKPISNVSNLPEKDSEYDTESEITTKLTFDRRRPGFQIPETDKDTDEQYFEERKTIKRPQSNKRRPGTTTLDVKDQDDDTEYETTKPSKRPTYLKSNKNLDTFNEDADEGPDNYFDEKIPLKQPQSKNKLPNVGEASNDDSETGYESENRLRKPESNRRQPSITADAKKFRKPINSRPGVTKQSTDNTELDSERNVSSEDDINTVRPVNNVFGNRSKPDKQLEKPSGNFEAPQKEDDYDYSLIKEADEKSMTKDPVDKIRGSQRKKPNNASFEEEIDEEDDGQFLSQDNPSSDNPKKFKQGENAQKPSASQATTSQDETSIDDHDDKTTNFRQSTPPSNQLYPYSTQKPFIIDGDQGYQYLPPQNRFNESPGRFPEELNGDLNLPNKEYIDRNRPTGFQSPYSTTGAQNASDSQQMTSSPNLQDQYETTSQENVPTNYYKKDSEQNVTPSSFAPSKIQPQTAYETGSTRRPFYGQTSQNTQSPYTQKYPVTERNRYQTSESTPDSFTPSQTPGFSTTYGPTQSTSGNTYGDRYSTTGNPFRPTQSDNKNYYPGTRPTYLPSSERPFGSQDFVEQKYPSGKVPSTTYRPNYSTSIAPNYSPGFGSTQQEYNQNLPASQIRGPRPIYGPGSTTSERNIYPTDGPKTVQPNYPIGYPQGSTYGPNGFSTTESPNQGFGLPTGIVGQGNRPNDSGLGPTGNGRTGYNQVIGEDFSGPRRPQTYDPETGYHYK